MQNTREQKRGAMAREEYRTRTWEDEEDHGEYRRSYRGPDDRGGGGGGIPWRKIFMGIAILAGIGVLAVGGFLFAALQGLPSLSELQNYQPPITSRVHAADGALVAEFAREQRVFVPIAQIPGSGEERLRRR